MKIGIITFHSAINYGAVLQCAALVRTLQNMGHCVQVIDYQPNYAREGVLRNPVKEAIQIYRSLGDRSVGYRLFRVVRRSIRCVIDWRNVFKNIRKQQKFLEFRKKHLPLTKRYTTYEQLKSNPPDQDVYICGSDQLWNADLTNGTLDPALFLDFGDEQVKRLSYAVSACNVDEKSEQQLIQLLKKLDYISLREKKNQVLFNRLSGKETCILPDPTQLLTRDAYEAMEEPCDTQSPYGFIYLLSKDEADKQCNALVCKLMKEKNITFWDGSPNPCCNVSGVKTVDTLSPGEWLYLIHNADYIITNSFHCLSFATIYHKECFILPCHPSRMERLVEFAESNGIKERILYSVNDVDSALNKRMDYAIIEANRKESCLKACVYFKEAFVGDSDIKGLIE